MREMRQSGGKMHSSTADDQAKIAGIAAQTKLETVCPAIDYISSRPILRLVRHATIYCANSNIVWNPNECELGYRLSGAHGHLWHTHMRMRSEVGRQATVIFVLLGRTVCHAYRIG